MKRIIIKAYYILLRLQGACVLAFVAMFWLGLSTTSESSLFMIVPVAVAAFVTGLAVCFAIPQLTPAFLKLPSTKLEMVTIVVVMLVGGGLFVVTIMGGIALYGIAEPLATQVAIWASIASIVMSIFLMACNILICAMGGACRTDQKAQDDITEIFQTLPPLEDVRSRSNKAA